MLIKHSPRIRYSEVTPKHVYLNRRRFLSTLPAAAGALLARNALGVTKLDGVIKSPFSTNEKQTPLNDITHYNNYYEFGTAKEQPAELAGTLKTSPWSISVEGVAPASPKYSIWTQF